jgi:hypothetical protein
MGPHRFHHLCCAMMRGMTPGPLMMHDRPARRPDRRHSVLNRFGLRFLRRVFCSRVGRDSGNRGRGRHRGGRWSCISSRCGDRRRGGVARRNLRIIRGWERLGPKGRRSPEKDRCGSEKHGGVAHGDTSVASRGRKTEADWAPERVNQESFSLGIFGKLFPYAAAFRQKSHCHPKHM